jgi:phosphoribosylanthranilate isomerase
LAIKIKKQGTPIIISGGLAPSNIVAAIHTVRPYAVDVNSGVEKCPGKKSHILIKALMAEL